MNAPNTTKELELMMRSVFTTLHNESIALVTPGEHEFLKMLIRREQLRAERWEKIKIHVLGWGIVGAVGWLGAVVLDAIVKLSPRGN